MMNKLFCLIISGCLLITGPLVSQTPCEAGFAGIYPCSHVDLLAHVVMSAVGCTDNTNDIWGWVSPNTGREYALLGCANGTSFVDISDPSDPVYVGFLPTHTVNSLWRDIETYSHYAFVGSEAQGHGLQVFDLLQLDEVISPPVIFEETTHYGGFGNSHTINIDPVSGLCMAMGSNTFSGGLHLVDISDPLNPSLAGGFSEDGYTHDGYILTYNGPDLNNQGKVVVVACNADALTIVDCTDPTDCFLIDTYSYPQTGYVHQGWFTRDKSHFLVDDELDELDFDVNTRTHIFDLTDLENIAYEGFYQSNNSSIDHNLYILDQFVFESNYRSGVRVLDAIKAADGELFPVGFFDLVPANDNPTFSGTWSNYPFLPSGVDIATSMYDGFFVLRPNLLGLSQDEFEVCGIDQVVFDITVNADLQFPLSVAISGLPGSPVVNCDPITEPGTYQVTLSNLLSVQPGNFEGSFRLVTSLNSYYELPLSLTVSGLAPVAPELSSPANDAVLSESLTEATFSWLPEDGATGYTFQLASDAGFNSIIEQQDVPDNSYIYNASLPSGEYYWRARMTNTCGSGPWSEVFGFTVIFVQVGEEREIGLNVFPNPASDQLILQLPVVSATPIVITDIGGRTVMTVPSGQSRQIILNISSLRPGLYIIRNGEFQCRFVKQ